MKFIAILSKLEEEYLMRASEAAIYVRKLRQLFLWTQGQLQGLLPHRVMVCIQFGDNDEVVSIECLDGDLRAPGFMKAMCDGEEGLAVRLALYCRANGTMPCVITADGAGPEHPLNRLQGEVVAQGLGNALVHGTERMRGGATFFALFSMPEAPMQRQVFFFDLLLPYLHLAFQRAMMTSDAWTVPPQGANPLTVRELEILSWVTKGKSNFEIGEIIHLSHLTVKNHLQNIYRKLDVHNRVQAISRCYALQLLTRQTPGGKGEGRKPPPR